MRTWLAITALMVMAVACSEPEEVKQERERKHVAKQEREYRDILCDMGDVLLNGFDSEDKLLAVLKDYREDMADLQPPVGREQVHMVLIADMDVAIDRLSVNGAKNLSLHGAACK